MSTWHVLAIERLGAPSPTWPTVYGPTAGADPITANALHTLDLTPYLAPIGEFGTSLDQDLVNGSTSNVQLDLADADGSLATALGPSGTLGTTGRYYGPWIEVWERWGTTSEALRFRGYLDESSLQWSEEEALTQASALHASQLIRERLVTDYPSLLRPWPVSPDGAPAGYTQSTADAELATASGLYTPRTNAAAIEAALWAIGRLTWTAGLARQKQERMPGRWIWHDFDPPTAPSYIVTIGTHTYVVESVVWDTSIGSYIDGSWDDLLGGNTDWAYPAQVILQGAPNLTGILTLGATVTWSIPEAKRTHYALAGGATSIAAPVSGSDGPKSLQLSTVEQLVPGDVLTLTFSDATSGSPRTVTADLPPIIDLDGETGTVYLSEALSQGYTNISKIRRNSQDPVLFDGKAYAETLVAPFGLDLSQFVPAPTNIPVMTWLPYDQATPSLYGVHLLQSTAPNTLRAARRGASSGTGTYPTAGVWARSSAGTWSWSGALTADATHQVFGDVNQFPMTGNTYAAPVIYVEGDLSGSAPTPTNGWRHSWRTWRNLNAFRQDPESTWDGTSITWASHTAVGDIPWKLVAYFATSPSPCRYSRTASGPSWSCQLHTADGTLGTLFTPPITGTLPSGNWIALGMGLYGSPGDDREALLGLVVTGGSYPFSAVSACLLSQSVGGGLAVVQTSALWTSSGVAAGPWDLGGGLVVQSYSTTIDGISYPVTKLHRLDGATVVSATHKTLEIIPQTIQPLLRVSNAGSQKVPGWYALALETYADGNFAPARRLRFLQLDAALQIINGEPEADPSAPESAGAYFSRGDVAASIVPDGAVIAKMFRLDQTSNEMVGIFGSRIFQVSHSLPATVERLKTGATAPTRTRTIAGSGDGMTASDYLEKFAGAQLASLVPTAAGGFRLVSRSEGAFQVRSVSVGLGGSVSTSVSASERGPRVISQVWAGYIRKVRVTYADPLANTTATVEVQSAQDGGRVLELDYSDLLASTTTARALGVAAAYWFGYPAQAIKETWADRTGGTAGGLAPVWWADWQVGDLVTFESYLSSSVFWVTLPTYKIMSMSPGVEARTVSVELRAQPFPITVHGSGA